jgi:hypothetical protein
VVSLAKPTQKLLVMPTLLFVALSLGLGARSTIALPTKTVLVLYSNNRLVPGNVAVDQVLINLVLNAMDAVADLPESRRRVEVLIEGRGGRIWAQNCEASGAAFFVELPTPTGPAVSLSGAP